MAWKGPEEVKGLETKSQVAGRQNEREAELTQDFPKMLECHQIHEPLAFGSSVISFLFILLFHLQNMPPLFLLL